MRILLSLVVFSSAAWTGLTASGQSILYTFDGNSPTDTFGQSVDIIGDANGDGFADMMVGAWRDDDTGNDAGSVRVISGIDGSTLYQVFGDFTGQHMGFGSSGAGDIDGDGFADVCAAANQANFNGLITAGKATFVSSATQLPIFVVGGDAQADLFGWATSVAGDVNNDGFVDVVVGSLLADNGPDINAGSATVISGFDGSPLMKVFGFAPNDNLGFSVSGGDLNNDGFSDVIAGSPASDVMGSQSGAVYGFSGADKTVLISFFGDSANDNLARSVSGGSDVNGDGCADIVVGAETDAPGFVGAAGSVYVISGLDNSIIHTIVGKQAGGQLGTAVLGSGDVDGDGFGDFAIGSRFEDANGSNSGTVRFYSGRFAELRFVFSGDSPADSLGTSLGGGGDVNGDGFLDIISGAIGDDNNGSGSGSARVFSLVPLGVTPIGVGTPSCFGPQTLNATSAPAIGNADFGIFASPAPPSGIGLLMVGSADLDGSDLFGDGTIVHIAFPPFGQPVTFLPTISDPQGVLVCPLAIANDPSLIGLTTTFQHLSLWPDRCSELGFLNISSSSGLTVVVQP